MKIKLLLSIAAITAVISSVSVEASGIIQAKNYTEDDFKGVTTFVLNQNEFELPVAFSELLDKGWNLEDQYSKYLDNQYAPGDTMSCIAQDEFGDELDLYIANLSDADVFISDMTVVSMSFIVEPGSVAGGELSMKNGIKPGMTLEEVVACFDGTIEKSEYFSNVTIFGEEDKMANKLNTGVMIEFTNHGVNDRYPIAVVYLHEDSVCQIGMDMSCLGADD